MNPHDQTGPTIPQPRPLYYSSKFPSPDFLSARLFATVLFGVCCLVVGFMAGEQRGLKEGQAMHKPCPKTSADFKDMTRKQLARWQQHRENEAKGWIVK